MRLILLRRLTLVGLIWGLCAAMAQAAPPETLTLADLANQPDRWPATVTLQRDLKFRNGIVLHQGDNVRVERFDGSQVLLLDPAHRMRFNASPEDCGLLDAANQIWSALTPAQRAISPDTLADDRSLWPVEIGLTSEISCNFGKLPAGTEVNLLTLTRQNMVIAWPSSPNRLELDFRDTDVIARARKLALVPADQRPSRIAAALQGILVDSDGQSYDAARLADKKIFALYFGAGWCPPCQAFSPGFAKFVNDTLPKHPELAVVFLSDDKQRPDMFAYMKKEDMNFPAVPPNVLPYSNLISTYQVQLIPHLIVVDRFGKVLADNDDGRGNRVDPMDTVAALGKLLAAAPAVQ